MSKKVNLSVWKDGRYDWCTTIRFDDHNKWEGKRTIKRIKILIIRGGYF